jgi:hypothetical protein
MNDRTMNILRDMDETIKKDHLNSENATKIVKVKKGWAVCKNFMFLSTEGEWVREARDAKITFERKAVSKALDVHGRAIKIEVLL